MKLNKLPLLFLIVLLAFSCRDGKETYVSKTMEIDLAAQKDNVAACLAKMEEHLNAVSNRDLATLKSTMSPNGDMLLILPQTETIVGVDAFMDYHKEWFEFPNWTFTTSIVDSEVSHDMGFVIIESMYREPERNGVPYFNRMTISYDLQKIDGTWFVVKDHATSVEKSTDKKE